MKKNYLLTICVTLIVLVACTKRDSEVAPESGSAPQLESVPPAAQTGASLPPVGTLIPQPVVSSTILSLEEQKDLLFIREEEKLARDVYLALGTKFKLPVFTNITESESRHMDAILGLLKTYLLADPTVGKGMGEFFNSELQTLYNDLIKKAETATDALLVGGIIEEKDIQDIQKAIARSTRPDVRTVYTSLICGSQNHLRAFADNYQKTTGASYKAQIITQDEVDRVLNSVDPSCK